MADLVYEGCIKNMGDEMFDFAADTFKLILLPNTHTPDAVNDEDYADVSGDELGTALGYTAGGATIANTAWTLDGSVYKFDGDDVTWATATFTARYGIIYDDTGPSDELVCLFDFGGDKTGTGGDFTVHFDATGILRVYEV